MPRRYNGHFATAKPARLEGVGVCPWCRSFAFRPPLAEEPFIDPIGTRALVCRCGYDSRRGRVSVEDFVAALKRAQDAAREHAYARVETDGADACAILDYQATREFRRCEALVWLAPSLEDQ